MHSLSEGRAHSSSRDHVSGNEAYLRSEAQLDTSAGDALERPAIIKLQVP